MAETHAPLFCVSNHHGAGCGEPPAVDGDAPNRHHGYFENRHGEQAVFVYEHASGEAALRLGDAGWAESYRVVDGSVQGLILNEEGRLWLRACWLAATG